MWPKCDTSFLRGQPRVLQTQHPSYFPRFSLTKFTSSLSPSDLNGDWCPVSGFKDRHLTSTWPHSVSLRVHISPNPDQSSQIRPNLSYFILLFSEKGNVGFKLLAELDIRSEETATIWPPQRKPQLRRSTRGTQAETLKGGRLGSSDTEFLDPTMPEARLYWNSMFHKPINYLLCSWKLR